MAGDTPIPDDDFGRGSDVSGRYRGPPTPGLEIGVMREDVPNHTLRTDGQKPSP